MTSQQADVKLRAFVLHRSKRAQTFKHLGTLLLHGEPLQKRRRGGIKVTGGLSRGRKRCLKRTARESHVGRLCRIAAAQKAPNRAKAGGAGSRRGGEARHSPLHTAWEFFRSPSSRWRRTLFAVVNSSLSSCTADLPKRLSSSNKVSNKLGRASPSLLVSPLPADF